MMKNIDVEKINNDEIRILEKFKKLDSKQKINLLYYLGFLKLHQVVLQTEQEWIFLFEDLI